MLLCISLLTSGLAAFTFGKAAFSRSPKAPPPNTSGQSAKGPLNLRTAVCGSVQSIDEIWFEDERGQHSLVDVALERHTGGGRQQQADDVETLVRIDPGGARRPDRHHLQGRCPADAFGKSGRV